MKRFQGLNLECVEITMEILVSLFAQAPWIGSKEKRSRNEKVLQ